MSETRPWGRMETLTTQEGWLVKRLIVQPGRRLSLQHHQHRSECWVVVRGQGVATIDQRQWAMQPGDMFRVPAKIVHRIENIDARQPLELVEVQLGAALSEADIVRLEDDYGRVPTAVFSCR